MKWGLKAQAAAVSCHFSFLPLPLFCPLAASSLCASRCRAAEQSARCQDCWMNPVAYCWGEHVIWIRPISCNKRAVAVYEIFIKGIPWRLGCIQMCISNMNPSSRRQQIASGAGCKLLNYVRQLEGGWPLQWICLLVALLVFSHSTF